MWKLKKYDDGVCKYRGSNIANLGEPKWYDSMISWKLNYHLGTNKKRHGFEGGAQGNGNKPLMPMDPIF